ncbi:MAG: CopD family protein [Alphaproteobacteria bacterium]|nr:CopD family protein [Alphaproteobacteria bacterium]
MKKSIRKGMGLPYELLKTLHIASVLVWFGGVLMNGVVLGVLASTADALALPAVRRLRRWDLFVSNSAQALAWVFGIWLIVSGGWYFSVGIPDGWLLAKLVLVSVLSSLHGSQTAVLRKRARGLAAERRLFLTAHSAWLVLACAIAIPLLVVFKPF